MYRSLNIKLVLVFVVLIITVMTAVGVFLINSVFSFYADDFTMQINNAYSESVEKRMKENLFTQNYGDAQKELLLAYAGEFGFDGNRVFYILDTAGKVISSFEPDENSVVKTANIISAMNGKTAYKQILGADYMDYAIRIDNGEKSCILYIKDNLFRMHQLSDMLFNIIIQSLMIGLCFAIFLSFVLARAITQPILSLTKGTIKIAEGQYTHRLKTYTKDEIGVLTKNFNTMAQVIESTLLEVSGEREKLKTILDCLEDGVVAFDENGDLLHTNPRIVKMLCVTEKDNDFESFTKKLKCEFVTPEQIRALESPMIITEQNLSDNPKNTFLVDISFSSFSYDIKKKGLIAVVRDVTERSLLEKSRREFIANVSHELRTPLTSIKGATEAVYTDDEMPDSIRRKFLSIVMNEADRMTHIVKDLLVLSRLDNRRMSWSLSEFSICKSAKQTVDALSIVAKQKNLEVSFESSVPEEYSIYADKERIEQVLTNIIGNSVKYTQDGGKIEVSLKKSDKDEAVVVISDNGMGIPKEDLPRLFERFYRVEKSRSSDAGGTGLGLSIAKEIIDAHGGEIKVESAEGEGTTTTITIPQKAEIKI